MAVSCIYASIVSDKAARPPQRGHLSGTLTTIKLSVNGVVSKVPGTTGLWQGAGIHLRLEYAG